MSVCCQDQTIDNQVLEGRLVKEGSGHNQQSVEPFGGRDSDGTGTGLLCVRLYVCLSVCMSVCLSVYLSVCMLVCAEFAYYLVYM